MNNLASIRNYHRGVRYIYYHRGQFSRRCLLLFSNDFPVIFQVFINIHEHANEIFCIYDHRMKELIKLYNL